MSKNYRYFGFISLGLILLLCGSMIYKIQFERKFETRKYINEIVDLKIDSCHIEKYSNVNRYKLLIHNKFGSTNVSYEFFIGNKYRASVDSVRFVPFKSKARANVCVKNILGEIVVTDYSNSYFQSDMDKLMNYFQIYIIQNK